MDFLKKKPLEIDCLPAQICLESSRELADPNMVLRRIEHKNSPCPEGVIATIKPSKTEGCKYFFALRTDLLPLISTGRYQAVLQEGCDYCACNEIQFTDRCMVVSAQRVDTFVDASCPNGNCDT